MRNLKKFLALVLAMLMVVSAAATVSAFEDVAEENPLYAAITKLDELGIVKGMTITLIADGSDEADALEGLAALINTGFSE